MNSAVCNTSVAAHRERELATVGLLPRHRPIINPLARLDDLLIREPPHMSLTEVALPRLLLKAPQRTP